MPNTINFKQVEKSAKIRDFENEKEKFKQDHNGINEEEVNKAMQVLSKATGGKEIFIGTKRSSISKVKFVQSMQENLHFLYEKEYLTGREKIFLMEIMPYIAFSSNCIVLDIKIKNPVPANISEIAKLIKSNRSNTSTVINSLKKKGILAKAESGIEDNNAKAYAIYINPHIMYTGDKDNVHDILRTMFYKSMKMPILKNLPNRFF
ncbi:MarR family transcriptional regulator [Bacillus thuringiensis]|nr:MarR family transcriptional regulator [Bacillus thuringiensis]